LNVNATIPPTIKNYTFSATTGTFTPVTGGTATTLAVTDDEAISNTFNIGFAFNDGGTSFSTVQATSN